MNIADYSTAFIDEDTVFGTVNNLEKWLILDSVDYVAKCERARNYFKSRFHIQRAAERLLEIISGHEA